MNENLPVHDPGENNMALQAFNPDSLMDLSAAVAAPVDLMSDYWTPVNVGESRRVYFDRIQPMGVQDQASGDIIYMDCAFFYWQENPGQPYKQIRNGSKRLVGAITSFNIQRGTPLEIRYAGKKRNSTNPFLSDNWSITPLQVNVSTKQ
jgi:hypothetical protein